MRATDNPHREYLIDRKFETGDWYLWLGGLILAQGTIDVVLEEIRKRESNGPAD